MLKNKNIFTRTFEFSIKRANKSSENDWKSKTTSFLELFFDLAIVFIFAILARSLATFIGISPKQLLIGKTQSNIITSHPVLGFFTWLINFLILWITWFRYGAFFKRCGSENFLSHLATFLLVLSIAVQALGIGVNNEWLKTNGTILSFLLSSLTFMLITWANFFIKKGKLRKRMAFKYSIKETVIFLVSFTGLLLYVILEHYKILEPTKNASGQITYWKYSVALIVISIIFIAVNIFFMIKNYHIQDKILAGSKGTLFWHTIERHHLFVIISAGESILFNIGDASSMVQYFKLLILDLIINITVIMLLWYSYKIFLYRPKFEKSTFNVYLYVFVHILIIFGMLMMTSSLKVYGQGLNQIEIEKNNPSNPANINILNNAIHTYYSLMYIVGYIAYAVGLMLFILLAKYKKENIYSRAIIRNRPLILFSTVIFYGSTIAIIVLLVLKIVIPISLIMGIVLMFTIGMIVVLNIRIQSFTIKNSKNMEEAIEELDGLRK